MEGESVNRRILSLLVVFADDATSSRSANRSKTLGGNGTDIHQHPSVEPKGEWNIPLGKECPGGHRGHRALANRLNLAELEKREVTTAEGRRIPIPIVK